MKLDKIRCAALERRLNVLQDVHGSYLVVWVPMHIDLKAKSMRTGPPEIDMTALERETATSFHQRKDLPRCCPQRIAPQRIALP